MCLEFFSTLKDHGVYGPSYGTNNTGTSSKHKELQVNKMCIEWVEAVDNIHIYNNLTHNNIGIRRHMTSLGRFMMV